MGRKSGPKKHDALQRSSDHDEQHGLPLAGHRNLDQRARPKGTADSMDRELMDCSAVSAGSRLLVTTVLASLDDGVPLERLGGQQPFLSDAHVIATRCDVTQMQAAME
jgi:hypothetical protein